ncbi:MAG: hypothetical protein ACOYWZ_10755 [Bacillota bacterium]
MQGKYTGYKDINSKEIYSGMLCEDTVNFVTVVIKEIGGRFYAAHSGLEPEPLEEIVSGLKIIKC